ncbi:MAG: serine/threonine protein kinase [Acidobacteria bacterium]|nr:serine/threonine protein kinase [Acidobacteriota bacterium]
MNAERLQRIEEICHAALDATPEERAAFLEKQCGADADLRREVESLLDFDKSADLFFDSSPESFAAEMFSERENGAVNLVNREVGHYRILKLLGRGGMGEVYLAEDKELERHVAVKVLLPEVADDRARLGRFVREARAASALNHPNILTVHEIGGFENSRFIATEFVAGETLRDRLRGAEPLDLRETLDAALQIAAALAAAHEAGIVHRDIKPENIMLRDDGFVKVLDFGLAKLTEERRRDAATQRRGENESTLIAASQTESGVVMGTAAYMSPEQARGLAVDARTDIWSFGIVLYENNRSSRQNRKKRRPENQFILRKRKTRVRLRARNTSSRKLKITKPDFLLWRFYCWRRLVWAIGFSQAVRAAPRRFLLSPCCRLKTRAATPVSIIYRTA